MPPKKVMPTCVAMKSYNRAQAMKSQRKKIAKCVPVKREAKKLQAADVNRMKWVSWDSKDDGDGPWDSTSMHGDADSMGQTSFDPKRNHAQWVRDELRSAPVKKPSSNVSAECFCDEL